MVNETEHTIFGMPAEKGRWALVVIGLVINLCTRDDLFVERLCQTPHRFLHGTLGQNVSANDI